MGTELSEHTVLQGHDSLAFRFSHDGANRAPITSEGQDPNLLEDSEMNPSEILFLGSAVTLSPDLQVHIGPWHHNLFCKHSMI